MKPDPLTEWAVRFKALSEPNRLLILGLLAAEEQTVEQLAERLGLAASTVSHHLARLSQAGFVRAEARSYFNYYRLKSTAWAEMRSVLASPEVFAQWPAANSQERIDRKLLGGFLNPDGSLKELPAQNKKFAAALRYVIEAFENDRRYTEKEINAVLARFHHDVASLRRGLISSKLLMRTPNGSAYWRTPPDQLAPNFAVARE